VGAGLVTTHAVVWISHREARVLYVQPDKFDELTVATPQHLHRRHPKGEDGAKEHPDDAKRFFHEVSRSLEGIDGVLVVGPSTAKLEFIRYAHKHDHPLEAKIVGIETVDHPTDRQLAAHARAYFKLDR
jgi:hypothetical protein